MAFVNVAGFRTFYAHHRPVPASKPAVVFLHGAGGGHQHWLYPVRDLSWSPSYAPDLPGHGRSEGVAADTVSSYGDWTVAFLDALGQDRAVLVGHSMGGAIAMDVALRYPHRVAGLGLVASGARLRVAPAILEGLRQDKGGTVRLLTEYTYGPEVTDEMLRLGRRQLDETPADVLVQDFTACDRFDVMERVGHLTAPTLVVCGTKDRMTPIKYSIYLRDRIAGASLQLVEGAGHMVMVERPQAVVRALSDFLAGL
jgi:pimeloyl-ACP methyl ester carboxylesterase